MKKLFLIIAVALGLGIAASSCSNDDNKTAWDTYAEWREANDLWVKAQEARIDGQNGQLYFKRISPTWDPGAYVLMHWFNDPSDTQGNLVPLISSTVSTCYIGRLYTDEAFDSSYTATDGLFTSGLTSLVPGWQIALTNMHVGDTCEIVIPYLWGYGASSAGIIKPYSALKFNLKLVDIPAYEVRP